MTTLLAMMRGVLAVGVMTLAITACGGDDSTPAFDSQAWRTASVQFQASDSMVSSPNERCQLVDQISDVLSAGMSVDEVTAELGQENMTVDVDRLTYKLGVCGVGVDYDSLWITLEGGRVKEWRVIQG